MARLAVLTLVFLLSTSGSVRASGPGVFEEEIVVTATGLEEDSDEVPATVAVIDRKQIEDAQAETVADLLRRVAGATVSRSGGEGSVASLFLRGTESDHTLVLLDGVRLNSPYFGGFDWGQALTTGLERVEVVPGPYSALWGADAVGGVVNLIPARSGSGLAGQLLLEGGQDSWRRLEGSAGWGNDRLDLLVSGLDREGTGELPNSDFSSRQELLDAGWSWDGGRLGLVAQDVEAASRIPFSGALPTPLSRQRTRQRLLAIPLSVRASDSWTLELQASAVQHDLAYRNPEDPYGYTASDTDASSAGVRVASHHKLGGHTLSVGGEWRRDEVDDSSSYGVNLTGEGSEVSSLFVQDNFRPFPQVRLLAGVRYDDASPWGSQLSPRLSASLEVGRGVELRASYGRAFREPSVGELYFPSLGNPDLDVERSRSYEVGVAGSPASGATWQVALYETRLDDLIEYDFVASTFRNVSNATIRGAEAVADIPLSESAALSLQLTRLDTEGEAGEPLLRRPDWSASATVGGRFLPRLRGDLTLEWVGSRDDVDPITFERVRPGSFAVAHLALAWRFWTNAELTARIVNLADRRYEEVVGYPAPRRRLLVGMRLSAH